MFAVHSCRWYSQTNPPPKIAKIKCWKKLVVLNTIRIRINYLTLTKIKSVWHFKNSVVRRIDRSWIVSLLQSRKLRSDGPKKWRHRRGVDYIRREFCPNSRPPFDKDHSTQKMRRKKKYSRRGQDWLEEVGRAHCIIRDWWTKKDVWRKYVSRKGAGSSFECDGVEMQQSILAVHMMYGCLFQQTAVTLPPACCCTCGNLYKNFPSLDEANLVKSRRRWYICPTVRRNFPSPPSSPAAWLVEPTGPRYSIIQECGGGGAAAVAGTNESSTSPFGCGGARFLTDYS